MTFYRCKIKNYHLKVFSGRKKILLKSVFISVSWLITLSIYLGSFSTTLLVLPQITHIDSGKKKFAEFYIALHKNSCQNIPVLSFATNPQLCVRSGRDSCAPECSVDRLHPWLSSFLRLKVIANNWDRFFDPVSECLGSFPSPVGLASSGVRVMDSIVIKQMLLLVESISLMNWVSSGWMEVEEIRARLSACFC